MPIAAAIRVVLLTLLCPFIGFTRQAANAAASDPSRTLFVPCEENKKPKHILSPISQSETETGAPMSKWTCGAISDVCAQPGYGSRARTPHTGWSI